MYLLNQSCKPTTATLFFEPEYFEYIPLSTVKMYEPILYEATHHVINIYELIGQRMTNAYKKLSIGFGYK